jgi:hypothetical protein
MRCRPITSFKPSTCTKAINHAEIYVRGHVHTNGIENFWSLLKRSIGGTYVSVEPFHLFRYVDEQSFRFNNRHDVVGRRVTCKKLTGKETEGGLSYSPEPREEKADNNAKS